MNDPKKLKIAIVVVIVLGIAIGGVFAYKYERLNSSVAAFSENIQGVKTSDEAKHEVKNLLETTNTDSSPVANMSIK